MKITYESLMDLEKSLACYELSTLRAAIPHILDGGHMSTAADKLYV